MPFVLPTVVVGTAFLALGIGPSLGAILLAHVFFNYAVVVRTVGGLWAHLDPRQEDAARVLGAGRIRAFFAVTVPALRPAVLAAASIVFLFDFTSFGVILILGGPSRATLETEIYRQTAQLLHLRTAAALSILQLAAVVALLLVTSRLEGRRSVALSLRSESEAASAAQHRSERAILAANLGVMAVLLGRHWAVLVIRSFDTSDGIGFGWYRALGELRANSVLFVPPTDAIRNSLLYALTATLIAVVVGGLAAFAVARSRRPAVLDAVLTPAPRRLRGDDRLRLPDRARHATTRPAHVVGPRPDRPGARGDPVRRAHRRARAARSTPACAKRPPCSARRPGGSGAEVDLPIAARSLLVAGGFAFAISLGEFGATVFIARPQSPTLPVVIFRLLGQPGAANFGAAMAASTILMALTAAAMLAIDRFRLGDLGAF